MSVKLTNEVMKAYMGKRHFVEKLSDLFREEGILDVRKMEYTPVLVGEMEVAGAKVTVTRKNGFAVVVDVTADSKLAILQDVLRRLSR